MFDDEMHHQDQLFHQFISSSSSSPPPSSSASSRSPPSYLHQHHLRHLSITTPFPNFDNPTSSFSIPSPQPPSSHGHSIQFHDLFHHPNLAPFPHLNQAPSSDHPRLIIPSDQPGNSNPPDDDHVHHNKDVGLIRSLLIPPAASTNLVLERERSSSSSSHHHSRLHQAAADDNDIIWSNEEVVALLRIRSSSETSWFPPEFTWEHVSRKLAEIGFKRSSEKCKEKFEEESRTYFNKPFNINTYNGDDTINNNSSYKVFGELAELCRNDDSNKSNNTDDEEEDEDVLINNKQQRDMEVEEAIVNKACNNNVFEDITAANIEIEEVENLPSPIYSQSADRQLQSDHQVLLVDRLKAKKRVRNKQINREHIKKFKIMCEGFVKKMMSQQEELHNKILEDLSKRDEVSVAREEAWKRMEMERLDNEIEMRAHEQAIAGDRQASLIDFLNKLSTTASATAYQNQNQCIIIEENIVADILKVLPNKPSSDLWKVMFEAHVENDQVFAGEQTPPGCHKSRTSLQETLEPYTSKPNNIVITKMPSTSNPPPMLPTSNSTAFGDTINNPKPSTTKKAALEARDQISAMSSISGNVIISEDYGKRWPRDEVLALINLRCSFMNNNNNYNNSNGGDHEDQRDNNYNNNGSAKAPLWERISHKMSELGYKRSAKRCKEKWENINKYFRKTKDNNVHKKRSVDSRTCPYFHQLSHLYKRGTLINASTR